MAVLFTDGFDANNPYYSNKYDDWDGTIPTTPLGRTGNTAKYRLGFAYKNLSTNYSTIVAGFAYKTDAVGEAKTILKFMDASTTQTYLYVNTSNQVQVKNGDGTTLGTSTSTISDSEWTYIELKTTIGNSGSFYLKINGITEASGTSVDTQNSANSYATKVALGNDSSFNDYFDDYYIDSTDFQGTVRIFTISPTANSSVAWTPNTGDNYECLDDSPYQDGDTSYVSATTTSVKDLYTFASLGLTSGVIRSVSHNFTARKSDLNPTDVQPIIKTSSTEYTGTTQSMTTSYICYQKIWETNPFSGVGWTYGAIDNLIAGFQTV